MHLCFLGQHFTRTRPLEGGGLRHAWLGAALLGPLLWCSPAGAQETFPGESERAIPGLLRMSMPTRAAAPLAGAAGAGYGYLDSAANLDAGHRFRGSVAVAYAPSEPLILALDMRGHADFVSAGGGGETKFYGEPRVTARFAQGATEQVYWGLEADLRLVGGKAPSIDFAAASPSGRGLLALRLQPGTWIGAQLGLHLDRSAEAVPDPALVLGNDRRTLGASSWTALAWGAGASYRPRGLSTEFVGELAGEGLLGQGAPPAGLSPWHLGVGARHPLNDAVLFLAHAEVGLSRRLSGALDEDLVPVEPRVSLGVGVVWRFGVPPKRVESGGPQGVAPPKKDAEPKPAETTPPVVLTSPVSGTVVDEGGRPLADALVILEPTTGEPVQALTAADGAFVFESVPEGKVSLRVSTPGFEEELVEVLEGEGRVKEIVLRPAVPAGQVRGKVLDLRGNPVTAQITVSPGGHSVEVQPDGSFELELAPGRYTVRFEHAEFGSQRRTISVQNRGVVILNIALTK